MNAGVNEQQVMVNKRPEWEAPSISPASWRGEEVED